MDTQLLPQCLLNYKVEEEVAGLQQKMMDSQLLPQCGLVNSKVEEEVVGLIY